MKSNSFAMERKSIFETRKELGEKIRELRTAKGLSVRSFAESLGLNYSYISKIERGEINTTIDMLSTLAGALGGELAII